MICFRHSLSLLAILVVSALQAAAPADYIGKVISARESIQSMNVKIDVERKVFKADADEAELLSGSKFRYQFWLSESVKRVDCSETRPKDPLNAAFQKFSRNNETVRTISGNGNVIFTEQNQENQQAMEAEWIERHLTINPAFVGFWPDHFELLNQFSPQEILGLCSGQGISASISRTDSHTLVAGGTTVPPSLSWEFKFDADLDVPISIKLVGFSGEGTVDKLSTNWTIFDGNAVPITCVFERTSAGAIIRSEIWSLIWESINQPIKPDIASWVSMGIKDHDVVQFMGHDSLRYGEWINGKFREWQPTSIVPPVLNPDSNDSGFRRKLLIAVNLFLVGVLLIYFGRRGLNKNLL